MTRRSDKPLFPPFCAVPWFCFAVSPRKRRSKKTACLQGKDLFFGVADGLVTASRVTL